MNSGICPTIPTAILQWNCRGLRLKKHELVLRLRSRPIPILALCEGALPGDESLPGYIKYSNPALPTFPYGSAALYVKQGLPQHHLDLSSLPHGGYECVAVSTRIFSHKLTVACVYIHPDRSRDAVGILEGLRALVKGSLIVCGDLNAHHPSWGSVKTCSRGRQLADEIASAGFVVANTGAPTFLRGHSTTSAIDVTIHTPDLPVTWHTAGDTEGSDHFPIHIGLGEHIQRPLPLLTVVHWDKFRSELSLTASDPATAIAASLQKSTKSVRVPASLPCPDLKLCNFLAARKRAQRTFRRTRLSTDGWLLKKADSKLRRHSKRLQKKNWHSFCGSLSPFTSTTKIWRVTDSLCGERRPSHPFSCLALALSCSLHEAAERFANAFDMPSSPLLHSTSTSPSDHAFFDDESDEGPLDARFTILELRVALHKLNKKSAPGPDNVTNQALKNLPEPFLDWLLAWLNEIWLTCNVPTAWKTAWIVPVIKRGQPTTSLASYRPVSLLSCMAKLFERLLHRRLTWFLEANNLLSSVQTGFRPHLAAQDSLLDFQSDLEHNRVSENYTLAVFLDVQKAFDSVSANTAVECLRFLGLKGRILRFLGCYLNGRSFSVKLGKALSTPRPLLMGLPQGSVLSPTLFNVVMARVAPSLQQGPSTVSATFYADDICVWSSGRYVPPIQKELQISLNGLSAALEEVGLVVAPEKSRLILFPGKGRRTRRVSLSVNNSPIPRVREQRFLGLVVDARNSGVAHVKSIIAATRGPANAIKRLCGTRWGGSPSALLHLHSALVVSRITYGLPYLDLSPTQQLILERVHRAGVKLALGVPRSTSTAEIYADTNALPIMDTAINRLLGQLVRLHRTVPGRRILDRVAARTQSQAARHLKDLRELLEDLCRLPPSPWPRHPPWQGVAIVCRPNIPGLKRKSSAADIVLRTDAETYLEERYPGYLRVFTDGSVSRTGRSATAAFTIPSLRLEWSGRLSVFASSTTAEVAAITEALRALSSLPPRNAVVLTDSACAIQRLSLPPLTDASTHDATDLVCQLTRRNQLVVLQWIPGHVGISGNTRADHLASEAHRKPNVLTCTPDFRGAVCELRRELCEHYALTLEKRPPALYSGLSRAESTSLARLRTRSAYTKTWLFQRHLADSPNCSHCGAEETVAHLLFYCAHYSKARAECGLGYFDPDTPWETLRSYIHPTGNRRHRRERQQCVLTFLRLTHLHMRV